MFKTRLISGIILVIIALATIISGSWILFFTLLAVSLIGMRELYKVMKVSDEHVTVLELVGYLGAVLYYIAMKADFGNYGTMAIIISMILILFVYVFGYPKYHAEQVMAAFFGVVYVAVMLSFIYLTRSLPDGKFLVWLIFLCSWGCDTCAYCVGMLIGKHKMAPVLSPKKSIEGAVGGVAGAALLGVIYAAGLTEDMLVKILKEPKNAILKQYKKLLALDEVKLEFEDGALHAIARKALERHTGARALRAILEEYMLDIMYEIPKDDNIGEVVITEGYIQGNGGPKILMRGQEIPALEG